jgi:hypothetical protein
MEDHFTLFDVLIVLLLVGVVLTGCGGSATGASGKSGSIDACQLITKADAEAALGETVKAPENPITGEGIAVVTSCKYTVAAAPSVNNVSLIVRRLDTAAASRKDFEQLKQDTVTKLNVTPEDVAGIGDGAIWIGGIYNQLSVLHGKVQLLISVMGPQGATPDAAAKTLAAKALSRLPQ